MIDLQTLGQRLRERRRSLRIPSAELARRIGVSPTYVWLIERARPRPGGEPSRPGEEVLDRWMAALGTSETEARGLRALAGYFDPDEVAVRSMALREVAPFMGVTAMAPPPAAPRQSRRSDAFLTDTPVDALHHWATGKEVRDTASELHVLLDRTLEAASHTGRADEAAMLLGSFLRWLAQYAGEER